MRSRVENVLEPETSTVDDYAAASAALVKVLAELSVLNDDQRYTVVRSVCAFHGLLPLDVDDVHDVVLRRVEADRG